MDLILLSLEREQIIPESWYSSDKKFTDIQLYEYIRISKDKVEPKIVYL